MFERVIVFARESMAVIIVLAGIIVPPVLSVTGIPTKRLLVSARPVISLVRGVVAPVFEIGCEKLKLTSVVVLSVVGAKENSVPAGAARAGVFDRVMLFAPDEGGTDVGVAVIIVLAGIPVPETDMPTKRFVVSIPLIWLAIPSVVPVFVAGGINGLESVIRLATGSISVIIVLGAIIVPPALSVIGIPIVSPFVSANPVIWLGFTEGLVEPVLDTAGALTMFVVEGSPLMLEEPVVTVPIMLRSP